MFFFKKYQYLLICVFFSFAGFFLYGAGFDSASLKYESLIADANKQAVNKYKARESELLEQGALHVAKVKALERSLKPIEKEVIRYVTKDKDFDDSGCAVTNDGLQLVSRYIRASFDAEN